MVPVVHEKYFCIRQFWPQFIQLEVIALIVPSSGVAASLLLLNGRTAHSRSKISLNLDESLSCSISKNTTQADLIIVTKLIL